MSEARSAGDISAWDLPTLDKIPVLRRLLQPAADGLGLDIGSGTGFTTRQVFSATPVVGIDLHAPNLKLLQQASPERVQPLWAVQSPALRLPFADGSFRYILCSEVLEHLDDDHAAVAELARVLHPAGRAVITVPYTGLGFLGLLDLLHVRSVHDYPGPEFHVRPGYDEASLQRLFAAHGMEVVRTDFYLRFFTKVVVDLVSLAHLAYQRLVHGRRSWNWSDAAAARHGTAFGVYRLVFPLLRACSRLDVLLARRRGFSIVVLVRKAAPA